MKSFKIQQSITDRNDNSLKLFFKDISKIPMIDVNEEIELSKRIQSGDESAVNKLVSANLRFAVSVAKKYQNKGLPLVDLIQEAVCGLNKIGLNYLTTLSSWVVNKNYQNFSGLLKNLIKFKIKIINCFR